MKFFIAILLACQPVLAFENSKVVTKKKILRVLSYNIRGIPFPVSRDFGRYKRIGKLIRQRNLDIVLLQESFSLRTWWLRRKSKFKNKVSGKGRSFKRPMGSGLWLLTNHKVLDVDRDYYDFCRRADCLANKGLLAAKVQVEGLPFPITVINTHMQAREVHDDVRQKQIIERVVPFLQERENFENELTLFSGDFNFKPNRESYHVFREQTPFEEANEFCYFNQDECEIEIGKDAGLGLENVYEKTVDRHFYYNPKESGYQIKPVKFIINFTEPYRFGIDGGYLSDHWGYEVHYEISWQETAPLEEN